MHQEVWAMIVFFLSAMLHIRNTPDSNCQVSWDKIIFWHQLWDSILFVNRLEKFSNPVVWPMWRKACKMKEEGLSTQFARNLEILVWWVRELQPLYFGSQYFVQNQSCAHSKIWDRVKYWWRYFHMISS